MELHGDYQIGKILNANTAAWSGLDKRKNCVKISLFTDISKKKQKIDFCTYKVQVLLYTSNL